jgi:hypothetical protein
MFAPFSSGYYLGRLYVAPSGGEEAKLQEERLERVNRELYADGTGLERVDHPLVMKLGTTHFAVHPDESVPDGTLAVPETHLEAADIENPPALTEVFLAKAEHASRLVRFGAV